MDKRGDINKDTPQVEGQTKAGQEKASANPVERAKQREDHPLNRASDSVAEHMKPKPKS
jgi:hypothetical protein